MRVCIYTPLNRLKIASGVPRHIKQVVGGLLRDPSLEVSFFTNAQEAEKYLPAQGKLWTDAPRVNFSQPVAQMSRRWGLFNRPDFETLGGSADWLYLPADAYVPVRNTKLAVTIHDVYKLEPPAPGENKLEHYGARLRHWVVYKRVAARADKILTVSQFSADRIMHHLGVPASRIQIVYNGVSPSFFCPSEDIWPALRDSLGLNEGEPFFVYAGGLKPKKNGHGIIKAWKQFEERCSEGKMVILGHHHAGMLESARRELKRALFPDRISDEQLAILLHRSTGLFFPSFYEGFGIPVVEAFAAGTMVILSDIPALRELAGELAFYVDPLDANSMTDGLQRCLAVSRSERKDRVLKGEERSRDYTWGQTVRRVRECLV